MKAMAHEYNCKVCGDKFTSEKRLKKDDRYCGYCEAVHRGKPDASWLPKINREEIEKKGFHRL
jgi:ribosomal protein L37AE/L43A